MGKGSGVAHPSLTLPLRGLGRGSAPLTEQILRRRTDQFGCRQVRRLPGEAAHQHGGLRFVGGWQLTSRQRNFGGYSNPAVDKIIEDSRREMNQAKRGELADTAAVRGALLQSAPHGRNHTRAAFAAPSGAPRGRTRTAAGLLLRAVGRGDRLRELRAAALHFAYELAQRVDGVHPGIGADDPGEEQDEVLVDVGGVRQIETIMLDPVYQLK